MQTAHRPPVTFSAQPSIAIASDRENETAASLVLLPVAPRKLSKSFDRGISFSNFYRRTATTYSALKVHRYRTDARARRSAETSLRHSNGCV